ncbi:hypothetical protein G5I_08028 [Acromyrmex echinatior]|uniref:Uncharacterized protein n=1 Tax=Acromyrmex echinatior TaxID=103372 RepID=F4WQD9_ACREC|nr:hypothetical protein G5I_08028 [Acromyrmex echinatior]
MLALVSSIENLWTTAKTVRPTVESSTPCLGSRSGIGLLNDSCGASPGSSVPTAAEALADQYCACRRRKLGVV